MKWKILTIVAIILSIISIMGVLKYPIDKIDQDILRKFLKQEIGDLVFDANWNDFVYFHTLFESLDGYGITGTVVPGTWGFTMTTGAISGNSAELEKNPAYQKVFNWHKQQRMKVNFQLGSITAVTVSAVVGLVGADVHYGFKVINNTVYGTVGDTSQSTIVLGTISANLNYDYEARFFPSQKVIFLIDGVEKGVLTTNLPYGGTSGENEQLLEIVITTNENVAKFLLMSEFEFIQKK